ncbi:alpha-1,2-fucosyltransferase [Priestia megaterium]|uniref:alpha-1,2-fucosyltransferase n=1 Tax=Priestia TaxID=2800373 RepID=UPI0035E049E1
MRVFHIEGGLGNQMACFASYVAVKKMNPNGDYFIETKMYDIPETENSLSLWNGYELQRIFGINARNIDELFKDKDIEIMNNQLKSSQYWSNFSIYHPTLTKLLAEKNINLNIVYGREEENDLKSKEDVNIARKAKNKLKMYGRSIYSTPSKTFLGLMFKKIVFLYLRKQMDKASSHYLYQKIPDDTYFSISLDVMKNRYLLSNIDKELRSIFQFPPIEEPKNKEMAKVIQETNSVSIHARRSDFLQYNEDSYKFGYFKRCTKFIKKSVDNPVFVIFSEDCEWCRQNLDVFGLDIAKGDVVYFVDWNKGNSSFRDMQLMSLCKHNVITKSSFGWWASFLNENPQKITCSQIGPYNTTHIF